MAWKHLVTLFEGGPKSDDGRSTAHPIHVPDDGHVSEEVARLVAIILAYHATESAGEAWPSVRTIALETGIAEVTARRAVKALERATPPIIKDTGRRSTRARKGGGRGGPGPIVYQMMLDNWADVVTQTDPVGSLTHDDSVITECSQTDPRGSVTTRVSDHRPIPGDLLTPTPPPRNEEEGGEVVGDSVPGPADAARVVAPDGKVNPGVDETLGLIKAKLDIKVWARELREATSELLDAGWTPTVLAAAVLTDLSKIQRSATGYVLKILRDLPLEPPACLTVEQCDDHEGQPQPAVTETTTDSWADDDTVIHTAQAKMMSLREAVYGSPGDLPMWEFNIATISTWCNICDDSVEVLAKSLRARSPYFRDGIPWDDFKHIPNRIVQDLVLAIRDANKGCPHGNPIMATVMGADPEAHRIIEGYGPWEAEKAAVTYARLACIGVWIDDLSGFSKPTGLSKDELDRVCWVRDPIDALGAMEWTERETIVRTWNIEGADEATRVADITAVRPAAARSNHPADLMATWLKGVDLSALLSTVEGRKSARKIREIKQELQGRPVHPLPVKAMDREPFDPFGLNNVILAACAG